MSVRRAWLFLALALASAPAARAQEHANIVTDDN
jgi:hypothetical protein